MKYKLKDSELHKKLDEISDGAFTRALNSPEVFTQAGGCVGEGSDVLSVHFGKFKDKYFKGNRLILRIHLNEIEESPEYNPNTWNSYPDVTPPEDEWMRCERNGYKFCARHVAIGEEQTYKWLDDENYEQDVEYFRPWDD